MERLSGQDAAFLALETSTTHLHLAATAVFDPSTVPGGYSFETVREVVGTRLSSVPALRRRLVEVPLGLQHPLWADDTDLDLDHHVRRAALPSPGGAAELVAFAAEVASRPLDRRRPLWELHVVEGLAEAMFAVVMKAHHAMLDGASAASLALSLLDLEPAAAGPAPVDQPVEAEPVPSDLELVADAMASLGDQLVAVADALKPTLEAARQLWERRWAGKASLPGLFSGPRTSLNVTVTPWRRVAFAQLPLGEVKRVKTAFGTTVNDVVLALCSAALRTYLHERGEKPDSDLVAMVPVSVRSDDEEASFGNRLSYLLVSLATTVDDPVERLAAVHDGAARAKGADRTNTDDLLGRWAAVAVPALAAPTARLVSRLRLMEWVRPPFNVTISSLHGPSFPLYLAGAPMTALYPMGPLLDGVGLNVTVISYLDRLNVGIVADRKAVPDVDRIARRLSDALDELGVAAKLHGGSGPPR